ncbi:glutathionylspermidine synthase family protein [Azospirillum doebereinerae]|uniref:Glutathionylspermidine synthase n=1 Tax=Azospirillum doebereinerae TaxID=92933 RepID=A0A433JC59_9PROT|nr:glutathionylspermidine synthase family protein [Azospirillum doebereinerae]MCG5239649.1 glutathionylspermidine synthase family protein [Azospirillum doebereinerae]RUQ74116.1 glutathionylspermidine synthase [Azospirillum doebereinerae]
MRRTTMKPRADWRPGLRKYPYGVRAMSAGAGWREDACYEFTASQIDLIESVADELHTMIGTAVRHVVDNKLFGALGIRGEAARVLEASWTDYWSGGRPNERAGGLAGRLTLSYDGRDSVKLLACNYDTTEGLFAASLVQRNWREAMAADANQFNGLHEALVERWEELAAGQPGRGLIHLTCATPDPVREGELVYLAATAAEAGIETRLLPLQTIGWDGRRFLDDEGRAISWLAKLYPWDGLTEDAFLHRLRSGGMSVLSPLWCWLWSNHGLLAVLSHLYPRHPNLCRAALDSATLGPCDMVTGRALYGLDAAPQRIVEQGAVVADDGEGVDSHGTVWLETPPGFREEDTRAVLHAWIVGDKCLGMSVRESQDPRVGVDSAVVPHLFRG